MPEMTVTVRWPDGTLDDCYSPSLVMHDHLQAGSDYTVTDFTTRATEALAVAAERVRAKYGFACTSAMATAEHITERAADFAADAIMTVLAMHPPLPAETSSATSAGARR
ncbi:MSMEG_0570 family nitrogen starvation response protein [Williamsia deligens]|uniref:MSMEG_0570 family nitrogen starvation response protein n=1 Tax=Williamsia deligens TaxID=321325 RepID=A0ABW3GB75_9NOCA|nr:MSMEG_0570 family nitrogen starvation response protein [Williamsia deligens]MCP2195251.1 MSMEG_0570 family protein [Williamsia deligens]